MKRHLLAAISGIAILAGISSCSQNTSAWQLESPDQSISITVFQQESEASARLFYTVSREMDGSMVQIIDPSPLGLVCEETRFVENLELVSKEESLNQKDPYTLVTGKKLSHANEFSALNLSFQNQDQKLISVIFRAYDDGIAFQYLLHGEDGGSATVVEEITGI